MSQSYPVLPLRDIVVFPNMVVPLFVGRDKSVSALEAAMAADKEIFLVAQLDPSEDDPGRDDDVRRARDELLRAEDVAVVHRHGVEAVMRRRHAVPVRPEVVVDAREGVDRDALRPVARPLQAGHGAVGRRPRHSAIVPPGLRLSRSSLQGFRCAPPLATRNHPSGVKTEDRSETSAPLEFARREPAAYDRVSVRVAHSVVSD